MMSQKQIIEKIYELEKELQVYRTILNTPSDGKMGRPKGSLKYTQEQVVFLRECEAKQLSDKEIIAEFNKKFNTQISYASRQLYNIMQRQGIRKTGWRWPAKD